VNVPSAGGVNVTVNNWVPPGIIVAFAGETVNSASAIAASEITKSAAPVFSTVTFKGLDAPKDTSPKSRDGGVTLNSGTGPAA